MAFTALRDTLDMTVGNLSTHLQKLETGGYVVIDKTRQQEKLKGLIKDSKKESYLECFDKNCQVPLGIMPAAPVATASAACSPLFSEK